MNLEERKQGHGVGRAALSQAKPPCFLKESGLDIILMTRQQSDKRVEIEDDDCIKALKREMPSEQAPEQEAKIAAVAKDGVARWWKTRRAGTKKQNLYFVKGPTTRFLRLTAFPKSNPASMCLKFPAPRQLSPCFHFTRMENVT